MTTVASIMTGSVEFVDAGETLAVAARRMRDMDVGALPVRGPDNRLAGIVTDRDIVVKAIAADLDPNVCTVRALVDTQPICVDANSDVEEAVARMAEHQIRRLPVVEGDQLVGMVTQADIARAMPEQAGQVVHDVSMDAPPVTAQPQTAQAET
ncbi:MAG: CBS domain-containing protein [Catenulispora sp.]